MFNIDDFRTRWSNYIPSRRYNDPYGEDVVVLASQDLIHQDTIGQSNCDAIKDDLGELAIDSTRAWVREVYVPLSWITDEEIADQVEEVLHAMEMCSIYNEWHYSDLESARLNEYIEEDLPYEVAHELGIDDSDELHQWILENQDIVWEHHDGSVDDVPFNVEAIAKEYQAVLV